MGQWHQIWDLACKGDEFLKEIKMKEMKMSWNWKLLSVNLK